MQKVKRNIIGAVLCASIIVTLSNTMPNALASAIAKPTTIQDTGAISPHTEETTWYLRIHDGKLQRRLWSNTRCIWLTDWMDCP